MVVSKTKRALKIKMQIKEKPFSTSDKTVGDLIAASSMNHFEC